MLLTGSEDKLCRLLLSLFQAVAYHLATVSPSAFQPLITESSHGDQLLPPPPFFGALSTTPPLYCVLVFSSLFIQFFWLEGQSAQGAGGKTEWCLTLTCLVCQVSPKHIWCWWLEVATTCFLSVTWHGEALLGLEVQVVEVLILFCALVLPCVAPVSQQGFWFTELMLFASVS
jgi:hypothetical protein